MSASAEAFWDRHAPKYAAKPIPDQQAYEAKLAHVRSLLKPSDTVLELGCGTGGTALNLADDCAHITASDVSGKMIGYARKKRRHHAKANVRFVQARATRMLTGAPFDKVLAFSMLHLISDVPAVLAAIHSQLKPDGLFISKSVCLKDYHLGIRVLVRALRAIRLGPNIKLFSQAELVRQLEGAGFEILDIRFFGNSGVDPFIVARRVG